MPIVAPRAETGRKAEEPRPAARVLLSRPGSAPFVQHAARALQEAGLLSAYVTTFVYQRDAALGRFLCGALSLVMRDADRQLSRRAITEVSHDLVRSHPLPEIIRMASAKGASPITTDRVWEVTEKWFDRLVARRHLDGVTAAYAYETRQCPPLPSKNGGEGFAFTTCRSRTTRRRRHVWTRSLPDSRRWKVRATGICADWHSGATQGRMPNWRWPTW